MLKNERGAPRNSWKLWNWAVWPWNWAEKKPWNQGWWALLWAVGMAACAVWMLPVIV